MAARRYARKQMPRDPDLTHPGTTHTNLWGLLYAVRANWADGNDIVQSWNNAGRGWRSTGIEVARYRDRLAALRALIEAECQDWIDAQTRDEIDEAMLKCDCSPP